MSTVVDSSLDYSQNPVSHGTYKHIQVPSLTGSGATTITTSGGQELIYECPQTVFNFSKSYVSFILTAPAVTSKSTNIYCDTIPFRQIQVYNKHRKMLVDLDDVNKYCNMVGRYETKLSEIMNNDNATASATWTLGKGFFSPLTVNQSATQYRPYNSARNAYGSVNRYDEASYVLMGSATNTASAVKYNIPFDYIKNTILAVDKDFIFDSSLYIRFVFAPSSTIYFTSDATTDPYTGAGAGASSVSISEMYCYIAQEQNDVVIQAVKDKVKQGLTMDIPYVYGYRTNIGSGTIDVQCRYNSGHGKMLKCLYWAPYMETESGLTAYDHSNEANDKVTSFYATINNKRLHEFNLDCTKGDDYLVYKKNLLGSCILNYNQYLYNFVWKHKLSNNLSLLEYPLTPSDDNRIDGLILDQEMILDIKATTARQLNHFVYAVVLRQLDITETMTNLQ